MTEQSRTEQNIRGTKFESETCCGTQFQELIALHGGWGQRRVGGGQSWWYNLVEIEIVFKSFDIKGVVWTGTAGPAGRGVGKL